MSITSPSSIGGNKSEQYLKINPQGKVPALVCESSGLRLAESDTISRYLLSTYQSVGPSFQPDNPRSNQIARFHDLYLTSIQACLYKPTPPFGIFGDRIDALKEFSKQLYVIADLMEDGTKYACGDEVSLADATLFPTIVFAVFMFPKFDGVDFGGHDDSSQVPAIPTKISNWFQSLIQNDPDFRKVYDEVSTISHYASYISS